MTYLEAAQTIDDFLDGKGKDYDWDDFTSVKISDPYLDQVRIQCGEVHDKFPPTQKGHYCSADGLVVLRKLASEIRAKANS